MTELTFYGLLPLMRSLFVDEIGYSPKRLLDTYLIWKADYASLCMGLGKSIS